MLSSINSATLPVLNSYYTKENVRRNVEPVYLQPKLFDEPQVLIYLPMYLGDMG